jgi:hypothetical protein
MQRETIEMLNECMCKRFAEPFAILKTIKVNMHLDSYLILAACSTVSDKEDCIVMPQQVVLRQPRLRQYVLWPQFLVGIFRGDVVILVPARRKTRLILVEF